MPDSYGLITLIRHWLPIVTFCPVNKLPDLIYVTLRFDNQFVELYGARKRIRKVLSWKVKFMEDLAEDLLSEFPDATEITIRLLFGRHTVVRCQT
jgi:hypothetical protein